MATVRSRSAWIVPVLAGLVALAVISVRLVPTDLSLLRNLLPFMLLLGMTTAAAGYFGLRGALAGTMVASALTWPLIAVRAATPATSQWVATLLYAMPAISVGIISDRLRVARAMEQAARRQLEELFQAEERTRRGAERALRRMSALQAITEALAVATTSEDVARCVVERAVPALGANGAWVCVIDPDRNALHMVAAAEYTPEVVAAWARTPITPGRPTSDAVLAGRASWFTSREEFFARYPHLVDLDRLGYPSPPHEAAAYLPLRAGETALGAIVFTFADVEAFSSEDREYHLTIAQQCAQALERARLYERERDVAETLQRSLLPQRLPTLPGLTAAARYVPAETAAQVGGDWYDLIVLDGTHVVLVMGDVAGKGIGAAAVMGQLRSALRAFAVEGHAPAAAAERLSLLLDRDEMATLFIGVLDLAGWTLEYVNAGHPPPLVIAPDGAAAFLEHTPARPLVREDVPLRQGMVASIPPNATLVLYTDGLIERRGEALDRGLERLREAAAAAAAQPVDGLLDRVLAEFGVARGADDVAVLAVRAEALDAERLTLRLPAVPASVGVLRHAVRRWLAHTGATASEALELAVAVGEAATNAIEHAYAADDATFAFEAAREDGAVTMVVRDEGQWRPLRHTGRGRGLALIRELADAAEVSTGEGGTTVTIRRRVGQGEPT